MSWCAELFTVPRCAWLVSLVELLLPDIFPQLQTMRKAQVFRCPVKRPQRCEVLRVLYDGDRIGGSIQPFRSISALELVTESAEWSQALPVRSEVLRWNRYQDA